MSVSSRSKIKSAHQGTKRSSSSLIWLIGGGVVMVALIAFAVYLNMPRPSGPIAQPAVDAAWINGMSLGDENAPVTVETYEDFLCPHCKEWSSTVGMRIKEDYVKAGKVRLVYKTFPLQGFAPGSTMAAQAASCAAEQNSFWPYHDRLFDAQTNGQAGFAVDRLINYAGELNLNEQSFTQCMSNLQHQSDIDATVQEGVSRGVTGTPSIFINDKLIPSDMASVQAEIDRLLAAAGQ